MAGENWVTVGGFIATTASAVAAFFAVRQSMLQRTVLTKPQIIINSQEVSLINPTGRTLSFIIENPEYYNNIELPIRNVGLGTALNIKYQWSFNYKKYATLCGFKETSVHPIFSDEELIKSAPVKCFNVSSDRHSNFDDYTFANKGIVIHHAIKKEYTELNYVMPVTQETSVSNINYPSLILLLIAEEIEKNSDHYHGMLNKTDAGQLTLRYEDISGNKITIKYQCMVQMIRLQSISENGPRSTFRIELQRIHTKTLPGLERLRKSYADFIGEHDYNKNK
ncbi:hypothetical protein ACHQI3_05730 [Raoultella planticola]|uniref:hypothetical protein n=1 Tax=Raoultella TaxID=160674 RepID=UPI000E0E5E4E|nr:hypothetical protein [Raoultella terrigena]